MAKKEPKSRTKAADAVAYDVQHLYWTGATILSPLLASPFERNVYIAAFAAYFRNVYQFLFCEPESKYARAAHYFPRDAPKKPWEEPSSAPTTTSQFKSKANDEVVHISWRRANMTDDDRQWRVGAILAELAPLLNGFVDAAPATLFPRKHKDTVRAAIAPFMSASG